MSDVRSDILSNFMKRTFKESTVKGVKTMEDEEQKKSAEPAPIMQISKVVGGGMSKADKTNRYFGAPPKGMYFGQPKDLAHIHDLTLSAETQRRLYGLGRGKESTIGEVIESRLGTDSRSSLINELADNTSLTHVEAEKLVNDWMQKNGLQEIDDPTLGRIIVPKDSKR